MISYKKIIKRTWMDQIRRKKQIKMLILRFIWSNVKLKRRKKRTRKQKVIGATQKVH